MGAEEEHSDHSDQPAPSAPPMEAIETQGESDVQKYVAPEQVVSLDNEYVRQAVTQYPSAGGQLPPYAPQGQYPPAVPGHSTVPQSVAPLPYPAPGTCHPTPQYPVAVGGQLPPVNPANVVHHQPLPVAATYPFIPPSEEPTL
eukprot:TRINITY_DN11837_c0_g1_i1.p1 TRINITY_DN11837_c0_g1~~TRINITY_DN11837_c0_g1_i1.p1  ORF type:complete len:166 (+),score=25.18 TRINITY_DN11837_c0_g1_i1:70-498(+)